MMSMSDDDLYYEVDLFATIKKNSNGPTKNLLHCLNVTTKRRLCVGNNKLMEEIRQY
jgi:hypothetical protein